MKFFFVGSRKAFDEVIIFVLFYADESIQNYVVNSKNNKFTEKFQHGFLGKQKWLKIHKIA
jgi:hypothetical protein